MAEQAEISPAELKFRCEDGWMGSACCWARQCPRWPAFEQPLIQLLLPSCLAVQLNKQLPAAITIFNPTGERLAFKVRLKTAPAVHRQLVVGLSFSTAVTVWACRSRPPPPRSMLSGPAR